MHTSQTYTSKHIFKQTLSVTYAYTYTHTHTHYLLVALIQIYKQTLTFTQIHTRKHTNIHKNTHAPYTKTHTHTSTIFFFIFHLCMCSFIWSLHYVPKLGVLNLADNIGLTKRAVTADDVASTPQIEPVQVAGSLYGNTHVDGLTHST